MPLQVPIAAEPQEADYLEMLFRLLPEEDVPLDGDPAPRPEPLEGETPYSLHLTMVHRPAAVAAPLCQAPLPVVLRAYGAYGLPADLSFCPDDLPLLDRCEIMAD